MVKNFRKRRALADEGDGTGGGEGRERDHPDGDQNLSQERATLEEIRLIQQQRERTKGIPAGLQAPDAVANDTAADVAVAGGEGGEGGEELVLQDTFAQETAITAEDPNMLKYVEQELARRRGVSVDTGQEEEDANKRTAEDALYAIPEHLKVKSNDADEGSTAWTTGIAEIQLPIEHKLRNIEETEVAKRLLQERRPFHSRPRPPPTTLPASYSADFYQRGREYAEKMRQENPEMFRGMGRGGGGGGGGGHFGGGGGGGGHFGGGGGGGGGDSGHHHVHHGEPRRQTATDDMMLERFRKRERTRMMRR